MTLDDLCPACLSSRGKLCAKCAPSVLPQLAVNRGWLKMIGNAEVEQKELQTPAAPPPVSELQEEHLKRKRAARRPARRGLRALVSSIRSAA